MRWGGVGRGEWGGVEWERVNGVEWVGVSAWDSILKNRVWAKRKIVFIEDVCVHLHLCL